MELMCWILFGLLGAVCVLCAWIFQRFRVLSQALLVRWDGYFLASASGKIFWFQSRFEKPQEVLQKLSVIRELKRTFSADKTPSKEDQAQHIQCQIDSLGGCILEVHQALTGHWIGFYRKKGDVSEDRDTRYGLMLEMLDGSPQGVVSVLSDGNILGYNKAFESFVCGLDVKNKSLFDILDGESHPENTEKLKTYIQGGACEGPVEMLFLQNPVPYCIYMSSIRHQNGVSTLYFSDISSQKTLALQLSQSQKMQAIGQLAGGIAHDFNNLLTAMIGFCDLLLLRYSPGDMSFNDIMQIKQNANRASNLVRQLLAFSRQQSLQPKMLDVSDTLAELSALIRRLLGPSIDLRLFHGQNLWLVKVDQGQLEQVIINLAVNARDAMEGGGFLNVSTHNMTLDKSLPTLHETITPGEYLEIRVSDTGQGISDENISRIFDPFFTTKGPGAGTGLGLSTVYGIIKQTGGFIQVESELSKGTTFSLLLPRHIETASDVPPPIVVSPNSTDLVGKSTILLVEDEDSIRSFSSRALRDKGYQVIEAANGTEGMDRFKESEHSIDLIISDVMMAPMDGLTFVKKIYETHPHMKVIFISGYTEDAFRSELTNNDHVFFLAKPFSIKELAEKIKTVISAP